MSNMFKSKDYTPSYSNVADTAGLGEATSSWLKSQLGGSAQQYGGEMVAGKTPEESKSLDFLNRYVAQGDSENTKLANSEIKKTLSSETYDPSKSGYYNAVKAESAKNLADTQASISDQSAGGGRYWGGARLSSQGDAGVDAANKLNQTIYGLADQERQNKLTATNQAMTAGQNKEQQNLSKASALQSLGGLDRTINQARDEAVYNEWKRSTQDYPLQIAQLASNKEPYYAQTTKQPSTFSSIMSNLSPFMLAAMMK